MIYALPTAFLLTIVMVLVLRPIAHSFNHVDLPSTRKQHVGAVPLIGGLAVYASILVSALVFPFWKMQSGLGLVLVSLPVLLVGMADDRRDVSVKIRLMVEIFCCLVASEQFGVRLETLGELLPGIDMQLHALALPVTIFSMVGVVNAYNMVDGLDGLSGGLAIMTFSALALLAIRLDTETAWQLLTVSAAIFGFLLFNLRFPGRSRASVFLGDAGTMVIGFILACYLIRLSQGENALITPVAALWLFSVPIMDTVAVMLRRIRRGRSPFQPDCEHLHHIFMQSGAGVNRTIFSIFGLQAVSIAYAFASLFFDIPQWISFWLFIAVFSAYYVIMSKACKKTYTLRKYPS